MTKIKFFTALFISFVILLIAGTRSMAQAAPRLYLDPTTVTVNNGSNFQVNVGIDVETKSATGAEVSITYPTTDVDLKSVTNGGFFTDFTNPTAGNGKITIRGYFSQTFTSKSGSGTFAVLTFTAKKDSGSGTIAFTCSGSGNDTFILDSNVNNILSCSTLNQTNLTYSSGQDNSTPTPTPISPPGGGGGTPNGCGGTCGSNYNCQSGYFCYTGYCRNPACPGSSGCSCPTITPTIKPRVIAVATPASTPQVVGLAQYDPSTFVVPTPTPETVTSENQNKSPLLTYLLIGGAFALLGGILFAVIKAFKGRSSGGNPPFTQVPPVQTPPVQTPPVQNPPPPVI